MAKEIRFDARLLNGIKLGEHNNAKLLLLTTNLVKAHDDFGTLLHYSAMYNNDVTAWNLIRMGSDIDSLGKGGKTPLMLAVQFKQPKTVKILLEADANIELIDATGKSVLQMIFDHGYAATDILRLFLKKMRIEAVTMENLVDKLTKAGCTLYHAAYLNDFSVMKFMLQNGVSINSKGYLRRTALHAVADQNDFQLAKWLVGKDADVNALDDHGRSPLLIATLRGLNIPLLHLLLEEGADPNNKAYQTDATPLFAVTSHTTDGASMVECAKLLLLYGAIPHNSPVSRSTIFDQALKQKSTGDIVAKYFIAQLVVLEKMGRLTATSVMRCNILECRRKLNGLTGYYKLCEQHLEIPMIRKLSLFNLLTDSDFNMRTSVRNETFIPEVKKVCFEQKLSSLCPYYYQNLMHRINQATNLVKLENVALLIVCRFFNGNGNECYIAARKIVGYLNKVDLKQMVQV